ncbi:transposase [Thioalkalivibrio denitrificans]|uniref:Transposase n=1 Tax=Thioalkalivibrio denitrificans TaxID=108003 RepID=A0A1V3NP38_9GAMM|nr:transposase [Thioalkalivibrio denitrificans]OOG26791.1 transposase [Thioalkalivibrio denitrificans]
MSDYRRVYHPGGLYFFTVVTASRRPLFSNARSIEILRMAFRYVMQRRPFQLEAIVILPDHLHCLWQLPETDSDYSNRWKMLKGYVSRRLGNKNDPIWQPRFWEHMIRDDHDRRRHMDYIHFNPVKHGLVDDPAAWPASSFRRYLERGIYPTGWGRREPAHIAAMNCE